MKKVDSVRTWFKEALTGDKLRKYRVRGLAPLMNSMLIIVAHTGPHRACRHGQDVDS